MSGGSSTSELIFPILSGNFNKTLSSLKRSTLSISNRLRSISEDSDFVCSVADAYRLPLIANERCGSWYIPPQRKAESAYFKSTDGHMGQWAFSLRRLNLQVLDVIARYNGCIIVDSTRRGKRMPDALSKTVPIWCAVINRLIFPGFSDAHSLHTPSRAVSESEHAQIESKLDRFTQDVESLRLDNGGLRRKIKKPLRPLWVTPDTHLPEESPEFGAFYPVVLCTASRRVEGAEASEGGYVQGAGDDNEGWARGLSSSVFWSNKQILMKTPEDELPSLIERLMAEDRKEAANQFSAVIIEPTDWLSVTMIDRADHLNPEAYNFDHVIGCSENPDVALTERLKDRYLHLKCRHGKLGSRDLRQKLPSILDYFDAWRDVNRLLLYENNILDLSIGVALAVLCLYTDSNGKRSTSGMASSMDKTFIKQRLSWIMTSCPSVKPSRCTLQSVNDFLFSFRASKVPRHSRVLSTCARSSATTKLFDDLEGSWEFRRIINNHLSDGLAGDVFGKCNFQRIKPTTSQSLSEYMYTETGTFKTNVSMTIEVKRRWIWRLSYNQGQEQISVHFVKPDGETEDHLYHILNLQGSENCAPGPLVLRARGEHPCEADFYTTEYEFRMKERPAEATLDEFCVRHVVKGPAKDYTSETVHTRTSQE